MILSVSRRTDIPAFYSDWFFNRLRAQFVDVRNPMNRHQVSRVSLRRDVVDCIVFWTKNPEPMFGRLDELAGYDYYFQFTINPYDKQLETNVAVKQSIIDTFKTLSDKIGRKRVVWRYDPILLSDNISTDYHVRYFEEIAKRLCGYTERCVISFVDLYKKTLRNVQGTGVREPDETEMRAIARELARIAGRYNIAVCSCAEKIDLSVEGIRHGQCIDQALISDIIGCAIDAKKDKNQRKECGCVESIDIGQYNTCGHGCLYCYANFNKTAAMEQIAKHDPQSSLLIGKLEEGDIVKPRKVVSLKTHSLFD